MTTRIIGGTGIEFPDATQQSTMAVPNDAPAFIGNYAGPVGIPNATVTKLTAITAQFDNAGAWNPTTDEYKPQVAGVYQIDMTLRAQADTSIVFAGSYIFKNGTVVHSSPTAPYSARYATSSVSLLLELNGVDDYVTFHAQVSGTGSLSFHDVYVSAHLVRAF